ncbi:hypothetical protein DMN91_008385 [Ooceraea biroi]|uniref:KIF-binding protein n=1 Tax=Ooceraea biroi TaxID=2015173 RepID=A0A026WX93_OOCBI|nr:protein KBP homolog [Ooceraea biroi]EZA59764.1 KBP-like protein [Ooceraea biroi]RLU19826.1 hypothetical protein DMN91_008385 [Ooceraea biroi]
MEQCETTDTRAWVKERYQEVQRLTNKRETSPSELHEGRCMAVKILTEILEALTKDALCNTMAAITHLNIGILQSDMQEPQLAKENFRRCIGLLSASESTPEGILPAISANNQIGIVHAQQGAYGKAKDFLEQAENLYIKFTEDVQLEPVNMVTIMGIEEIEGDLCARSVLEKLHTLTLYYLAQVCRELDDKQSFALYCHRTLSKQLSLNSITRDLDHVEWALNAATISQYFIEHDRFPQARHHLAAASCILQRYWESLQAKGGRETSESVAAEYETYDHRSADVARCWAKYGIALLSASRERLLQRAEQEDQCSENAKDQEVQSVQEAADPRFVDLEPELEPFAGEITDQYLLDFNDARPVFLNVRKWLDKAKAYYTFENHASDYAHIAQDVSQAYKYLAFFEENEDRQARMHKRRADTLEEIVQGLSPRFYRALCRDIWIELAETYSEMLDIKIDRLQASNEKPTAQTIEKIERLALKSVQHYTSYLESVEGGKSSGNEVGSLPDDQLFQALYSHFHIGRLYNKIITADVQKKMENMQNSINAYSFIVQYYDEHPERQEQLKKYEFIELSKEFVSLLPLTLDRLKQQQMKE